MLLLMLATLLPACPTPLLESPPGDDASPLCEAADLDPGPGYSRRLTHQEYVWTVGDVLGVDLSPWQESLPRESYVSGFKNTAWGLLATGRHVEVYAHLARVAAQALAPDHPWLVALETCAESTPRCQQDFVRQAAYRLFRRPATSAEVQRFAELFASEESAPAGARLVIEALLQAPQFLYRLESDRLDTGLPRAAMYKPEQLEGPLPPEGKESRVQLQPGTYRARVQLANDAPYPQHAQLALGDTRTTATLEPFRVGHLALSFDATQSETRPLRLEARALHRPPGATVAPRVLQVEVLGPLRAEVDPGDDLAYRVRRLSGYEMASRLSYFIWHSAPDAALLDAAADGELESAAGLQAAARRMLADPKARRAFKSYLAEWLHLDVLTTVERSPETFPDFSAHLIDDMRREIEHFAQAIAFDGAADWLTVFDARFSFLTPRLATYYGVAAPSDPAQPYAWAPESPRGGLLTQGALLTATTSNDTTSPVKRGIFVRERFLCESVPPPASNAVMQAAPDTEGLSTRERLRRHSESPSCNFCHRRVDPIGFGLEAFDATGRYRTLDDTGHPVDTTGAITRSPYERDTLHFEGARQLGELLATSEDAERCMVEQMYQYALGRPAAEIDRCTLEAIIAEARAGGRSYTDIIVAIVTSEAFRSVRQHHYSGEQP
ncbi:hypothetical protein DL240_01465 [Lujinxingia litoralis]|uniref:DUF1592 domain-containing protein n=1 Tax=Lujinxingia litoralis TaxID=2211119 RepID=A0A328CAR9_9DELT|nr:hypothetical protein DL240_01465 [Lujinxingia litoralis]